MQFPRERLEELIYGGQMGRRFTQDSPVLPDVWFEYARRHEPIDLLLTPYVEAGPLHTTPGALSVALRERLHEERRSERPPKGFEGAKREPARIAYNQSTVLARLWFDELIRVVLPMSIWWQERVLATKLIQLIHDSQELAWFRENPLLVDALNDPGPPPIGTPGANYTEVDRKQKEAIRTLRENLQEEGVQLTGDVLWMVRVVGAVAWVARECLKQRAATGEPGARPPKKQARGAARRTPADPSGEDWLPQAIPPEDAAEFRKHQQRRREFFTGAINAVVDLLEGLRPLPTAREAGRPALTFAINLNRTAQTTVIRSRSTIKADAATRVFDLRCDDLTWAVVDSGIDATHPAFRERRPPSEVGPPTNDPEHPEVYHEDKFRTRVVETYDFTRIELLLDFDETDARLEALRRRIDERRNAREAAARQRERRKRKAAGDVAKVGAAEDGFDEAAAQDEMEALSLLKRALQQGKDVDWELLAPFLRVPHVEGKYVVPRHEHGTHVAGILAGDWGDRVTGICPDLRLYDMRVLNDQGQGSEFNAIAALQFIRYLKGKRDFVGIHGVNLSLAIRHEVANYACGRTPICDECERLIGAGIVVVAAAGNEGYQQYLTSKGVVLDAYRNISITDPGNAEEVITVGSTHRFQPHTYGVSYFSSRGPTGDGRAKPDLVAPGEKIGAPIPGREMGVRLMDGTSMATPHVSGAAALLIARHRELAGQPEKIKRILCKTATDLGRERDFQGHGMVDILRALQSV